MMNNSKLIPQRSGTVIRVGKMTLDTKKILLGITSLLALLVFFNASWEVVIGPALAVLCVCLYFSGYAEFVTALILVANDALGTIFLGNISFPYLLLVLVLLRLFSKREWTTVELVLLLVSVVLQIQLWMVGWLNIKHVVYSLSFVLSLLALPRTQESFGKLSRATMITIVLIALHACVTGGVEFVEMDNFSNKTVRKGILGVGIGDPNYSSYLLNVGIICAWCDQRLKKYWKILFTVPLLIAMTITVSISGLLALGITVIILVLLSENKLKSISIFLLVVLVLTIFVSIYVRLPEQWNFDFLDGYIERVTEKLDLAQSGDLSGVTTNRSDILSFYLRYIVSQPILNILFGGNTLNISNQGVPHNTYVGVILQVGFLGFLILFAWITYRFIRVARALFKEKKQGQLILLKVLSLFMAWNLSFYQGSLWSLWMFFLVLL